MADVERKGCGGRIIHSFLGMLLGIVMFFGSFALLTWNEYDAVRQTGAITELEQVAIPDVSADSVNELNQGKLIHVAGEALTDDELEFRQFGVREKAIHLRWDASIYQWVESSREQDDDTIYEYDQLWVDQVVDSSRFHNSGYSNEGSTKHFHGDSLQAVNVRFGAFQLPPNLVRQINNEQQHPLNPAIASDVRPRGQVHEGVFYTGDPIDPKIGDEKVEVYLVGPRQQATIMAQQSGNSFEAYQTKVGIPKSILYLGQLSKDEVIGKQRTEVAIRRWVFRAIGFICMWLGLLQVFGPFRTVVSFIPLVNRLLEGTIAIVTFFFAAALWAITIAIAWFAVRPTLSVILLVAAAIALFFAFRARSKEGSATTVPPPLPS